MTLKGSNLCTRLGSMELFYIVKNIYCLSTWDLTSYFKEFNDSMIRNLIELKVW